MIQKLPDDLINQIAAGEVVERPASVVKELLENSIDAGATAIEVQINSDDEQGISILDNGCGIGPPQIRVAFERHTTSKIKQFDDLHDINTFGFRGEALPSIASVSFIRMRTKISSALEGTEVEIRGGHVLNERSCGSPNGTKIEVKDLFFNTPVRKKFLKSQATEFGHIQEAFLRLALGNPNISFRLLNCKKVVVDYPSTDIYGRVYQTFGEQKFSGLQSFEFKEDGLEVIGFASIPNTSLKLNKRSATQFYTLLNRRFIRDKVINAAITQAYGSLIDRSSIPYGVLYLNLPPQLFDVNVHPSKIEVRFLDQHQVFDFVIRAIKGMLANLYKDQVAKSCFDYSRDQQEKSFKISDSLARFTTKNQGIYKSSRYEGGGEDKNVGVGELAERSAPRAENSWFAGLRVIGQVRSSYIVCEDEGGLVVIDQHAAHERISFEKLKSQLNGKGIESQGLLFPITIDLAPQEFAILEESQEKLSKLGFDAEPFGSKSAKISSIPLELKESGPEGLFSVVLDELAEYGKSCSWENLCESILMRMACHNSVRFNKQLSGSEINSLLQELDNVDFSGVCPHGRPVFTIIPFKELNKRFGR